MAEKVIDKIPALTVTQVVRSLEKSVAGLYPRKLWIIGEILDLGPQSHPSGRYFYLVDYSGGQKCVLNMKLFTQSGAQARVEAKMDGVGFPLKDGMRVRFLCRLNFHGPKGELGAIIDDVDPNFTLGELALRREQLIAKILAAGHDKVNKQVRVPSMPLTIGVVSSGEADGWRDARKRFEDSKFPFRIVFCRSSVQGRDAPAELSAAIRTLDEMDEIDVILVIRGGGSKADLAAFDDEGLVMCIVGCRHPVYTGVGHEADNSIADLVVNRRCATPTAAAEEVIEKVRRFVLHFDSRAQYLVVAARSGLGESRAAISSDARLLRARVQGKLRRAADINQRYAARLAVRPGELLAYKRRQIAGLASTARLLDPATMLAKGWTLTRDADGRIIRSAAQVGVGDSMTTSFSDGVVTSEVKETRGT